MQLSVSFDGGESVDTLRGLADVADRHGAANVWIASHLFHREPIACAAAALAGTGRLGAVLMAMSPYTVHPVHAVMAAATLDEYFPGRVQLCFGVGAPRDLEAAGVVAENPLRTMRETLDIARALLAGETIEYSGERFKVSGRRLAMGAHPLPLWLAASGPQMLELAGEKADGVVISAASSPDFIRWSLSQAENGEQRAGRKIKKAALVFCSVGGEDKASTNRLRRQMAYILRGQHHARNLELAGTALDQAELAAAFARSDWDRVDALINDDVLNGHSVYGTPRAAAEALSRYQRAGLDEMVVYGAQDKDEVAKVLAIMPQPDGQRDDANRDK